MKAKQIKIPKPKKWLQKELFNPGQKITEHSQTAETFSQAPKLPGTEKSKFVRSVRAK